MDNATTNDALMDHISADLETEGIAYDTRNSTVLDVMATLLT